MKFLQWYTAIYVSYCAIYALVIPGEDPLVTVFVIAILAPVVFYVWAIIAKKLIK